ncbi:MAG: hypothetical protein J1F64_02875 [Oscillospiraceae bacterium]|nr:hypothetical protein [Oscillospiraceae bacterium]
MNFICKNCGGNIEFDIKSQQFCCSSCRTPEKIIAENPNVEEHDFREYAQRERNAGTYEGLKTVYCSNCGAEILFEGNKTSTRCPMCSSPNTNAEKQISGIPPDGLITFKTDKNQARENFRKWIKRLWFAPNKLKKAYQEGRLDGTYLPFWTFDADATAHYSGEGGTRYTTEDKDGKTHTKIHWTNVSGIVSRSFDDIQICALQNDTAEIVDKILPFGTIDNCVPYSPAYLSGFSAEKYSEGADSSYLKAQKKMERKLRSLAESDILRKGYDEAKIHSLNTNYSNVTYKNLLLPAWISSFGYSGKKYLYIINGETGKVGGKRPYSAVKIAAAIIIAALIALSLILFSADDTEAALIASCENNRTLIDSSSYGLPAAEFDESGTDNLRNSVQYRFAGTINRRNERIGENNGMVRSGKRHNRMGGNARRRAVL